MKDGIINKKIEDLEAFCEAQAKTIIELNKKLNEKQIEYDALKKNTGNVIPLKKSDGTLIEGQFAVKDEETICREQLFLLKNLSMDRELTMEEAKKVEIYSKVLSQINSKPKETETTNKTHTIAEILAAIEENESRKPKLS